MHRSSGGSTPLVTSLRMDRLRRRTTGRTGRTGRTLVGLVVVAAALYGGLAAGGRLDVDTASASLGSVARHAAVHDHSALVRGLRPARGDNRVAKSGLRETVALAVTTLAVALAFATRRRLRGCAAHLCPSYVRFGAPRAPPVLQLQP